MHRRRLALALALILTPAAARAQEGLIGPGAFAGIADIRLSTAGGERGWLDRGFGKTGLDAGTTVTVPRAALAWTPTLGFALKGHVTLQYQPQVSPDLDVGEAYLSWRAPPLAMGRASVRAGLIYPPVSLEHDGTAWSTPHMLSGSAINSWIGEEVLVGGAELTLRRELGAHEFAVTGAVFDWNDTSGTLLSFRGWALHGLTAGTKTRFSLPPLSPFMIPRQAPFTNPLLKLDERVGYYGRLEWRPPAPVTVSALYYDNVGNRIGVDVDKQWAWETRFANLGLRWEPAEGTAVLAQAMNGETLMGYRMAGRIWVDVGFSSAYLLARREIGSNMASARIDWFETRDRTHTVIDNNDEHGWAATLAWRRRLNDHVALIVEGQHVSSARPSRALAGLAARQRQTTLSTALRLGF